MEEEYKEFLLEEEATEIYIPSSDNRYKYKIRGKELISLISIESNDTFDLSIDELINSKDVYFTIE